MAFALIPFCYVRLQTFLRRALGRARGNAAACCTRVVSRLFLIGQRGCRILREGKAQRCRILQ
jgi:hypothetical protein